MTYASEVLADSPALYWRLGDASGTTAEDATANNRDGTYAGSPTLGATGLLTGDSDTAVDFDGVDDVVSWSGSAIVTGGTTISVECWFQTTEPSPFTDYLFNVEDSGGTCDFRAYIDSNLDITVIVNPTGTGSTPVTIPGTFNDGARHHLVFTYNDTTNAIRVFVDGRLVDIDTVSGSSKLVTINRVSVGAIGPSGSGWFDGVIDEFAVYTTELSPARVLKHYITGAADGSWEAEVIADSPLIFWRLDEESGVHLDYSGGGRDSASPTGITRQQAGLVSTKSAVTPTGTTTAGGSRADAADLDVSDVTLEIVAKTTNTGAFQRFGGKSGATGTNQSIELRMNASDVLQVGFRVDSDLNITFRDYTGALAFADGNWHHFAVTWSGASDTLTLYIDGQVAQTWSVPGTAMYVGTGGVYYGSREPGGDMVDGVDEFVYYGTALSSTRIAAHAAALGFGGDQTVTQGTVVTETDSVLAGTVDHDVTVTQGTVVTETDTALAGTVSMQTTVAQGSVIEETDSVLAGTVDAPVTIVQGSVVEETDEVLSGSSLGGGVVYMGGIIEETDTVLPGTYSVVIPPFFDAPFIIESDSEITVTWGGVETGLEPILVHISTQLRVNLRTTQEDHPDWRVLAVNMDGSLIAELPEVTMEDVSKAVASSDSFGFTLPTNDPFAAMIRALECEIQVWRGQKLMFWGVPLRTLDQNGNLLQVQLEGLDYYFTRRVIGKVPKRNYLNLGMEDVEMGRPAVWRDWNFVSLPRSTERTPPVHNISVATRYNEFPSLHLSGTVGRVETTIPNADLFSGTWFLTDSGWSEILSQVISNMGNKVVSVHVYDDDDLDRRTAKQRAQSRVDSITDKIMEYYPDFTVIGIAEGRDNPLEPNNSAPNREANRRTVFSYRSDSGVKGQKQIAQKFRRVKNPDRGKRKRTFTLSGYVYLERMAGFASNFAGIELIRTEIGKKHPDKRWRKEGYRKPLQVSTARLGKGTPMATWVRLEATVTLPNNGKTSDLEARLYAPNGDAYFSEFWLTEADSNWFKNEEQAEIIRTLVEQAQDEWYGKSDLNIDINVADTGVKRTREYLWDERIPVYDALNEFQTLADGVEWDIVTTPTTRTFTTFYPRRGRDTQVVLANDSNLASYSIAVDGTQISTTVIIAANGERTSREERTVTDASMMGGLILEKAYLATPNSPGASWRKQAERGLARYRRPVVIPTVTINPEFTQEIIDSVEVGDRVMTFIQDDWIDTAQKYRVTEMRYSPKDDTVTLALYPEDIEVHTLFPYNSVWSYFHQDQVPIVGANGKRPVESNVEFADRDFDDSGWAIGTGGFGWIKEPTGSIVEGVRQDPETEFTEGHEVWARRWVNCTGDMVVSARMADWGYVYVNGNLLNNGDYIQGRNKGIFARPHLYVPREYLDPSGQQLVAIHAQYNPYWYNGDRLDSLYADAAVRGTYDEGLIL